MNFFNTFNILAEIKNKFNRSFIIFCLFFSIYSISTWAFNFTKKIMFFVRYQIEWESEYMSQQLRLSLKAKKKVSVNTDFYLPTSFLTMLNRPKSISKSPYGVNLIRCCKSCRRNIFICSENIFNDFCSLCFNFANNKSLSTLNFSSKLLECNPNLCKWWPTFLPCNHKIKMSQRIQSRTCTIF